MRKVLVLLWLFVSASASADSLPIFNITQGSAAVSPVYVGNVFGLVTFQFSGSGFSMTGTGSIGCGFCLTPAPPGTALDSGLTIFSDPFNTGHATIFLENGVVYQNAQIIGLTFTPVSFSLPGASQSTFSVVLPVTLFASTVGRSDCDFTMLDCPTDIAIFNANSKATAFISFTNEQGLWNLSSAAFNLSPVPEPGTMVLSGSGLMALGGLIRRRRRAEG